MIRYHLNVTIETPLIHRDAQVEKIMLKILFNIAETWLKRLLNFDVCVVKLCSDGSINSQEYKSFKTFFKISMTEYHHL